MKRTFLAVLLALTVLCGLCVMAGASDFDAAAQELSEIGMFRGTGNGFDLDRAPTRAEAAVMLTRLYGAEEQAEADFAAGRISHPFTDVPAYAAPSVAWLYENGLTKGMSQTAFGAARACSLQDYTVFLLRALGYRDGVDFSYADALRFAAEKGFYSEAVYAGDFLRDDLAGLTYDALGADVKEGPAYLLKQLVSSGAIEAAKAAKLMEKLEAFRALSKACAGFDGTAADMDYTLDMDLSEPAGGERVKLRSTGNVKLRLPALEMDYSMNLQMDGETAKLRMWMKDGVYYIEQDGERYQMDANDLMDLSSLQALVTELPSQTASTGGSGLSLLSGMQVTTSGGAAVYTVRIPAKSLQSLVQAALRQTNAQSITAGLDVTFTKDAVISYTVKNGRLTGIRVELSMRYSDIAYLEGEDGAGASVSYAMEMELSMDMSIRKTGKDVVITFPDFSKFTVIDADILVRA